MSHRALASLCLLVFSAAGQVPSGAGKKALPRTPDGKPDLQGIWTNVTLTPLERPAELAGKATLPDAEAAAFEKKAAADLKAEDGKSEGPLLAAAGSAGTGAYNLLFIDRGSELARVNGVKRTSLIVDPPDGKVPRANRAGQAREGRGL